MDNNVSVEEALNNQPLSLFHLRAVLISGMGFFTDSYDLFIIGVALILIKGEWHPSATMIGLVGSTSLIAAFMGAFVFGRLADVLGRKKIYGLEAAIMVVGAVASAFSSNILWLLIFRFILGFGIGGDYPMSAVLMSEYANAKDRGKLVGMVFSMQALGMLAGPVVALTLLASGISGDIAWRIMLGVGALPAAAVVYLRRTMPESPRYLARAKGETQEAAQGLASFTGMKTETTTGKPRKAVQARLSQYALTLLGTAGAWFAFDYAYYGNSISTPLILQSVSPHASVIATIAWELIIFAIAAVPGYILAFLTIDAIGHRRLQIIGFALMGLMFLLIGVVPGITHEIVPFLIIYGLSYFFAEFGPNTTTFILAGEVFPVNIRTTGHGFSAGTAKVGAFIGVFLFPIIEASIGLSGTMILAAGFALAGLLVTLVLPEPSGRSLEDVSREVDAVEPVQRHA
ncbi:MAG: MFS transporter [Firmicutes bacterium]|nr:MFS transporter [Bacillota bacterium]